MEDIVLAVWPADVPGQGSEDRFLPRFGISVTPGQPWPVTREFFSRLVGAYPEIREVAEPIAVPPVPPPGPEGAEEDSKDFDFDSRPGRKKGGK